MLSDEVRFRQIIQREAVLDRDRGLVAFLRERLAERSDTATSEERALLAAVGRMLAVFDGDFEVAAQGDPADSQACERAGRSDALGWALRCVAFSAFSEHRDFHPSWRP